MNKPVQTVSRRITSGVALLLLFTVVIGGVAAWQMRNAATGARMLSNAIVPQAGLAARLAQASDAARLATRTYGLTGVSTHLQEGRRQLATVRQTLIEARQLAADQVSLSALASAVESADAALTAYETALKKTESNVSELAQTRLSLDAAANSFIESITDFICGQSLALANEIKESKSATELEERRVKLELANHILGQGNDVRIANFRSQALRDPESLTRALTGFEEMRGDQQALLAITRLEQDRVRLGQIAQALSLYENGIRSILPA